MLASAIASAAGSVAALVAIYMDLVVRVILCLKDIKSPRLNDVRIRI
jgi:hypothetical protein